MSKIEQALGLVIRKRRHKMGLSQEAFAEQAQVHRTYISSIELGKVQIGLGVAYKLAEALGIPLSRLISDAEREL